MNQILNITQIDAQTGEETLLGRAAFAPEDGQLTLLAAMPHRKESLARLIRDVNRKPALQVRVAPEEDSPKHAIATRTVPRDDEGFLSALQGFFLRYYDLHLDA